MDEPIIRNALPIGSWLHEYQIEGVLGKPGGFGITYLARDTNLQQQVAIKEYLPSDFALREGKSTVVIRSTADIDSFKWGLSNFLAEARVLAHFSHPNIVRVLRFFEANNTGYMVMEYQKGQSLAEYVKHHTLKEKDLFKILFPLLDGLEEIHREGFLHRDIKPTNIYIHEDGTPVLLDFGSARYAMGHKSRTITSIVSPGYAPLEQYDNDYEEQGAWTDIYALGAVLYFVITNEPPPAATRRVMKDSLIPATKIARMNYSKAFLSAIDWALELSHEDRPQNISQWRNKFLAKPVAENPENLLLNTINSETAYTPKEFSSASFTVTLAAIVGTLLLAASGGVILYQNQTMLDLQTQKFNLEQQLQETQAEQEIMKDMLKQVKRFADQTTVLEKGRFQENVETSVAQLQKFYRVVDVAKDDVLNIRPYPGLLREKIGEIPQNAECVLYLDKLHFVPQNNPRKTQQLWVFVRYENSEGWVNAGYLAENANCGLNAAAPSSAPSTAEIVPSSDSEQAGKVP